MTGNGTAIGGPSAKKRNHIILACEEMDFTWDRDEVKRFIELWELGVSISDMAHEFERDPDEVLILAIDQARKDAIKQREHGLLGVAV